MPLKNCLSLHVTETHLQAVIHLQGLSLTLRLTVSVCVELLDSESHLPRQSPHVLGADS